MTASTYLLVLVVLTLSKDQAIYPHTEMEMRAAGRSDHELIEILNAVRLGYLPGREGGWDCRKEWKDVLSGGEKQRISMARLLYHVYITLLPLSFLAADSP